MRLLKKPYPFNTNLEHNIKLCFFISIGLLIFLILFQPFELSELEMKDKLSILLGIFAAVFVSLTFNLMLIPSLFSKYFRDKTWCIWKEILWDIWILTTIVLGYVLYHYLFGIDIFAFSAFWIIKIVLLASIPIAILITINQDRLLRSNLKTAEALNKIVEREKLGKEARIYFESEYDKDSINVALQDLLFVRSAGNYIEVFWREGEQVKHHMLRKSMQKAEALFKDINYAIRCHRSYIINTRNINEIKASPQGYIIQFANTTEEALVSRKYKGIFQRRIV
jgi:LytTr DNA-binding domain